MPHAAAHKLGRLFGVEVSVPLLLEEGRQVAGRRPGVPAPLGADQQHPQLGSLTCLGADRERELDVLDGGRVVVDGQRLLGRPPQVADGPVRPHALGRHEVLGDLDGVSRAPAQQLRGVRVQLSQLGS